DYYCSLYMATGFVFF
nr:immunoglobulin light chain junction region [Macaca mulatta]MOV73386.1 immunoglobulin light chain junction region [Macaca mulatta]